MEVRGEKTRRWAIGILGVAILMAVSLVQPACAEPPSQSTVDDDTVEISLMSVADIHGTVNNWNYVTNEEWSGSRRSAARGLARISSLVEQVRAERGEAALLFDVGDSFQGTPLMSYYTLREPITEGATHPLALAMNAMKYDAMTVGNHEFNFGLPHLYEFERQLDAPLIAANVLKAGTDVLAFQPYVMLDIDLDGHNPIRLGVLGLTPTGSAVWDKDRVEGILEFADEIETARTYVPLIRAKGADVVVVAAHDHGIDIAEQVSGIDVLLAGHSHALRPEEFVTDPDGKQVLITQPGDRARYLSVADITLEKVGGQWKVVDKSSHVLAAGDVEDAPNVIDAVSAHHATAVDYVNRPIGSTPVDLSLIEAAYKDVAGMDLINFVQAKGLVEGLVDTAYEDLPALSTSATIHSGAVVPPGPVSVRDVAAMYIFDNTLRGIVVNGAQIKDYLEHAAGVFNDDLVIARPLSPDEVGGGGFCYDVIRGVSYDIDLSESEGDRIENLSYEGEALDPAAEFVLAINDYRHNGGCGYPHVSELPDIFPIEATEIQTLLIEYFEEQLVLDPSLFVSVDWQLTYEDTPIVFDNPVDDDDGSIF